MRKGLFIFISLLFLLMACSKRPGNVLDEDEMIDLMVDMELAESYSSNQSSFTKNEDRLELGQRVLASHGVSAETLDTTLAWYGRNLDEYSALFEKIDQEINRRRDIYMENPEAEEKGKFTLWPYPEHLVLSKQSGYKDFTFSLESPEIEKGEMIRFKFATASASDLNGILGFEYADGTGEAINANKKGIKQFEMELQSDTGKSIKRLYGIVSFPNEKAYPVYIDSLTLIREPYDSIQYHQKRRSQKKYGVIQPRKKPIVQKDTSLNTTETRQLKTDNETNALSVGHK